MGALPGCSLSVGAPPRPPWERASAHAEQIARAPPPAGPAGTAARKTWPGSPSSLFPAGGADHLRRSAPILHGGIGELRPYALGPTQRAVERREAVLVALARLGARPQEDVDDLRPAEECRPAERGGVVLPVEQGGIRPIA